MTRREIDFPDLPNDRPPKSPWWIALYTAIGYIIAWPTCCGCSFLLISMGSSDFSMFGMLAALFIFVVNIGPVGFLLLYTGWFGDVSYLFAGSGENLAFFAVVIFGNAIVYGGLAGLCYIPVYRKRLRLWRLAPHAFCVVCGYDLRGSAHSDTCPECGAPIPVMASTPLPPGEGGERSESGEGESR